MLTKRIFFRALVAVTHLRAGLALYTFIAIAYFAVLLPITIWAKRMEYGARPSEV